ncbi:hypothetical protein BASA60_010079 [Batrachochytrium salamandrivorans]|nr:hypothetical protein BASA60_010079 [Batrachochytrium salamandrivorans]KAH9251248.1 hypothetical protein BASA81_010944 [Batrachochytrium salamandrivorans]KAH9267136.1 hypothetical protein BASA83_010164 [Batrachochytrium salamandrivorans]
MPPRKTPPQALDAVRSMKGITFSFNLTQTAAYRQPQPQLLQQPQQQQQQLPSNQQPRSASLREEHHPDPFSQDPSSVTTMAPLAVATSTPASAPIVLPSPTVRTPTIAISSPQRDNQLPSALTAIDCDSKAITTPSPLSSNPTKNDILPTSLCPPPSIATSPSVGYTAGVVASNESAPLNTIEAATTTPQTAPLTVVSPASPAMQSKTAASPYPSGSGISTSPSNTTIAAARTSDHLSSVDSVSAAKAETAAAAHADTTMALPTTLEAMKPSQGAAFGTPSHSPLPPVKTSGATSTVDSDASVAATATNIAVATTDAINVSPTRVPIDSAYDLCVKVHAITSDALLYRMRGICTPEFAASKQPSRLAAAGSRSRLPLRNRLPGMSRSGHHRRSHSNSSADSSRQYTSQSSGDEFHAPVAQAPPVAPRRGRPPGSTNRGRGGKGTVGRPPGSGTVGRPPGSGAKRKLGSSLSSVATLPIISPPSAITDAEMDLDDDSTDYIDEKGISRKRKITHSTSSPGECTWCATRKTAQWRKGPTGPRGLCNACGLEWAKQIRHEAKRTGISNHDAEVFLIKNYRTSDRYLRYMREHNFSLDGASDDAEVTAAAIAAVGSSACLSDSPSSTVDNHPSLSSPSARPTSLSPIPATIGSPMGLKAEPASSNLTDAQNATPSEELATVANDKCGTDTVMDAVANDIPAN